MREILRKLQKNNRKGFTLAELLIVIAITGILASFGFVEVAKAQRKLKRTEMDNTAREIFVAAQNHLTSSQTNGIWNASYVKNDGSINIQTSDWQNAVGYAFTDYSDDTSVYSTAQTDTKTHAFYYVIYNKTTYAEALTNSNSVLQQLLPYGSIDDTIRTGGSYVIEFDAKTESIYGVFYTDKGDITSADFSNLNNLRKDSTAREQFSITDSTNTSKKISTAMGYYGGAKAYQNEVNRLKNPIVQIFNDGVDIDGNQPNGITLNSKNSLEAVITDPNYIAGSKQTILTVKISQKSGTGTLPTATFTIMSPTNVTNNEGSLSFNKTNYSFSNVTENYLKNVISTKASATGGIEYHISLDDITGDFRHFTNLFPLFTPGTDITVEAAVHYGGQADVYAVSKNANSLFDSTIKDVTNTNVISTSATGFYSADIRTARHLQNLSQDISGYTGTKNGFTLLGASLTADVDWSAFFPEKYSTNTYNADYDVTYYSTPVNTVDYYNFLSIYNTTLQYFDGAGHTLKTFDVAPRSQMSGLFSQIGSAYLSIKNVDLVDFNVSSSKQAGTVVADVNKPAEINNVHVYNSPSPADTYGLADTKNSDGSLKYYGVRSETSCAGGLIGFIENSTKNKSVKIINSSASVNVYAPNKNQSAGGLVGYIHDVTGVSGTSVIIDECYVGGKAQTTTSYGKYTNNISGYYAGGFVCFTENVPTTITNSYTTASVDGDNISGGFVGVAGGSSNTVQVSNVYAENAVASGTRATGLFVGQCVTSGALNVTSTSYVQAGLSDADNCGKGTMTGESNISQLYSNGLKKLSNASFSDTEPYLSDLQGSVFPYPAVISTNDNNAITHYGDWVNTTESKSLEFKKVIHFDSPFASQNERDDLISLIMKATYFKVSYGWNVDYLYLSDGEITDQTSDSVTITVPVDKLDLSNANTTYTFTEYVKSNYYDDIKKYFVSNSSNPFNTVWSQANYNKNNKQPAGKTIGDQSGLSATATLQNKNWTLDLTCSNHYKAYDSGFIYFEQYGTGGSYQIHGYYNTTEVGSDDFPHKQQTKVTDDGYLYVMANAYYDYAVDTYGEDDALSHLWICLDSSYSYTPNVSLKYLLDKKYIVDVTETLGASMGITGSRVYRLDFDKASSSNYSQWDTIWTKGEYSWIKGGYDQPYINAWGGISTKTSPIGEYAFNQYYADSVTVENPNTGDALKDISPKVRTASQLYRIILHDGNVTCKNWNASWPLSSNGWGINQELNIDMSSYTNAGTLKAISETKGMVYQGVEFSDATGTYPTLSGLKTTMFANVTTGSKIKNLNVTINTSNLTVTSGDDYGTFISKSFGDLSNVNFVNNTITNCKFGTSKSSLTNFGVIGYNGGDLTDVKFIKPHWDGNTIYATNIGLMPILDEAGGSVTTSTGLYVEGDTDPNNAMLSNNTLVGTNVGIVGFGNKSKLTNTTIKNINWASNTIVADYSGFFGLFTGTSNGLTIDSISWKNLNVSYKSIDAMQDITSNTSSSFGIIPIVGYSAAFTNTTISNVDILNLNSKVGTAGIVGNVYSNITNLGISNVHIYNDTTTKNMITGQSFGMIASIYAGTVDGVTVSKPVDKNYGFAMENLKLYTSYWGVVGYNQATIKNSAFNDILISGVDSTKAVTTVTSSNEFAYGAFGKNLGSITDFDLNRVQVVNNIFTESTSSDPIYVGIFGYNAVGTINNTGKTTRVIDTITIDKNTVKTSSTTLQKYGFIGRNSANETGTANVSDLAITNYTSGGYGFVYQNDTANITNVTLGSNAVPAVIAKPFFAAVNNGAITRCSMFASNASQFCESGTGSIDTCYVNGTTVTK